MWSQLFSVHALSDALPFQTSYPPLPPLSILVWQSTSLSSSLPFPLTEHSSASFPLSPFSPSFFIFFIRFHWSQKHNAPHLSCWLKMALSVALSFSLISSCLLVLLFTTPPPLLMFPIIFSFIPLPCFPLQELHSSFFQSLILLLFPPSTSCLLFSLLSLLPPPVSFPLPLTHHYSLLSPPFYPLLLFFLFSSFAHISSPPLFSPYLSSSLLSLS